MRLGALAIAQRHSARSFKSTFTASIDGMASIPSDLISEERKQHRWSTDFWPSASLPRGRDGDASAFSECANENGEFGVAYFARCISDMEPGSPPLAFFGPALTAFAHLEQKDFDLNESTVIKLLL